MKALPQKLIVTYLCRSILTFRGKGSTYLSVPVLGRDRVTLTIELAVAFSALFLSPLARKRNTWPENDRIGKFKLSDQNINSIYIFSWIGLSDQLDLHIQHAQYLLSNRYSWSGPPVHAREKPIRGKPARATTNPRPPPEISWRGESK